MQQRYVRYFPRHIGKPAPAADDATALLPTMWLAQAMGRLTQGFQEQPDIAGTLAEITAAGINVVPAADYAGISQAYGQRIYDHAPTHQIVAALGKLQVDLQQGPCLDALRERRTINVPDISDETRWPLFTAHALELGVGSLLSLQLLANHNASATLNLYARDRGAFSDIDTTLGAILAAHAGIALTSVTERWRLSQALDNRDLIGQAKGILMEREGIDADQAFDLLSHISQHTNRKLLDIARKIAIEHQTGQNTEDD